MDELSLLAESTERAALADLHAAATPELREALGLRLEETSGTLLSMARHEPSTLLNRAIGLGLTSPATHDTIADVMRRYAGAGIERYYLHVHPDAQPANLRDGLLRQGLTRYRGWMKFKRDTTPQPERETALQVRPVGADHAADFGRIAAHAFDLTDNTAALLARLAGRPGWRLYMSFAGEDPAGTGALFIKDGIGWLDWAATAPDHRRKGSQGAVLRRRIGEARDSRCRLLLTATGEEIPGDPQHSYRNILRYGFEPAYLRENYVPAPRR